MSILAGIAANWRFAVYGLFAAGLVIGGWIIKDRFDRAAEADRLEIENAMLEQNIEAERDLTQRANEARIVMSGELDAARRRLDTEIRAVTKKIRVLVPDVRACDLSIDTVKALNEARGHRTP